MDLLVQSVAVGRVPHLLLKPLTVGQLIHDVPVVRSEQTAVPGWDCYSAGMTRGETRGVRRDEKEREEGGEGGGEVGWG